MGKNKIIAFVILILVIIILGIVGILIYNNKQGGAPVRCLIYSW